jgi:hypothetical protein
VTRFIEKKCEPRTRVQLAIDLYRPLEAAQLARIEAQRWIDDHPSYWAISESLLAAYEVHRGFLGRIRDSRAELQADEAAWSDAIAKVARWLTMIEEASQLSAAAQVDQLPDKPPFAFTQPADPMSDPQTEGEISAAPSVSASGKEPHVEGAEWIDKGKLGKIMGLRIAQDLTKRIKDGTILREINGTKLGIRHHRIQVVSAQLAKLREEEAKRLRLEEQWRREKELGK